jgi:hypothetical protein
MKKNFYNSVLTKQMAILISILFLFSGYTFAQWAIYDATVMPDQNDPVLGTSGLAGAGMVSTLIPDPDNPDNTFLQLLTIENADNGTWRHVYAAPVTEVTIVMRVKSADNNGRRVLELDLDNGGFRERLYINQEDNLLRLQHSAGFGVNNEFPLPDNSSVKEWNIYRITKDAEGNVKLYVNEGTEPLETGKTSQATSNNHFRFGDTNGSHNVSALIDWIIWDTSGVYAPGEGKPIPAELNTSFFLPEEPESHNWRIYDANVFPNEQIPAFITSSGSFNETENQIIDDPDVEGNKLLRLDVSGNPQNQFLWRQNFATQGIEFEELTVVMRVKGNAERDMIMDLDMHFNDKRSRISIHTATNLARIRNGVGENAELTNTFTDWNIYRFTMTATETRMFVNEDPEAVLVFEPATAASANRHFRFGDGDSGNSMGADIDWVIWDYTGAYAPGEGDAIPSPVVTPNWDAKLISLMVDGASIDNFDADVTDYKLVLPTGTTAVPQLSATTSFAGATVEITQAEALPGEALVVVTAANGFTVNTYKVSMRLISTDASLADLKVNDVTIDGFTSTKQEYIITLAQGTTQVPVVTAIANDTLSTVEITPAVGLPGETIVVVTAEDGNVLRVTILFQLDTTSVGELDALTIKVYPNPSTGILHINYPSTNEHIRIRLVSMYGQVVLNTTLSNTIDISRLNNGIYILQLIDQDSIFEQVIIKN